MNYAGGLAMLPECLFGVPAGPDLKAGTVPGLGAVRRLVREGPA